MSLYSVLRNEFSTLCEELKDAFQHNGIPNKGVGMSFRFQVENGDYVPTKIDKKNLIEGSIGITEKDDGTFCIELGDYGSFYGADAKRTRNLANKFAKNPAAIIKLTSAPKIAAELIDHEPRFAFDAQELALQKKVIKYQVQRMDDIELDMFVCYDLSRKKGCVFQFYDKNEAAAFSKILGITEIEFIDEDGDLMETASIDWR